jgi:ligand-binding SRPBCC domain-containing protein
MRFVKESRIAAPPGAVFAFHEAPCALLRPTPPWERVEIVQPSPSLQPGSRVILRTWLGPIPLRWVAVHTEYDPPRFFADRQETGPFVRWYHGHRFLDDGCGGTLLRDEIEFEPPLGRFGRTVARRFLVRKLVRMFDYRHEVTRQPLESPSVEIPAEGRRG